MRRYLLISFVAFCIAGSVAGQIERGGTLPAPLPLFPAANWWNTDISHAPVDPNSGAFITHVNPIQKLHPDFGADSQEDPPPAIYGMVYITVPGTQPLEQVFFYDSPDESDFGAPGRPPGYPIPVAAKTETHWIEGGQLASFPDGDRHMLIVDRDHRILFELFGTQYNSTLNRWEASSGAIFPLDSIVRRTEGDTSADAAGLAILPGLVRRDEAFGSAPIKHALRLTVSNTNGYAYPGSHVAGSTPGALPMGARLRLKPGTSISLATPENQRIFQAMKTYGLIVTDNGSNMYITGTYDLLWDGDVLNTDFGRLHAGDFEVIRLGWRPLPVRGDLGGDVREDILLRDPSNGSLGVWQMNGAIITSGASIGTAGASYTVAATADFDGDGKSDILLRDGSGNLGMWRMNGSTIVAGAFVGSPGAYTVAGAADFDGDGRSDILLRDSNGNLGLWFMNGSTIMAGSFVGSPGAYTVAGVADFDGDGKPDILLRDTNGTLGLWRMNGATVISGALIGSPGAYTVAATADFDGDGRADILLRDATGTLGMWLMNGSTIVSGALVGSPGAFSVAKASDFDGDTRADILLRNAATGDLGLWIMNGPAIASGAFVGSPGTVYEVY
jgi:uncharacterized protein (DUF2141 family)